MEENIITFNFTNWITVLVMAVAGFVVFSVLAQAWTKYKTQSGG